MESGDKIMEAMAHANETASAGGSSEATVSLKSAKSDIFLGQYVSS